MSIRSVVSGISITVRMSIVSIIPSCGISLGLSITFLYTDNILGSSFGSRCSNGDNTGRCANMSIDGGSGCNSMGTGDKLSTLVLADISGSVDNRGGNVVGVDGSSVVGIDRGVVGVDWGSHMMVEGVCINHRCNRISSLFHLLGMHNGK